MVQQVSETKSGNAREMNVSTQCLLGQNSDLMTSACSPLAKVHSWAPCQQELEDTLPHCKRSKYLLYDKSILLFLSSVQFSCSVTSDSLGYHGLQHSRPPCPSPISRVYWNSCPLSWWCHPTISSPVVPFSSCLQSFPASVFSNESVLHIRWPKY